MQRLTAILFLFIFLFNHFGYRLLINYWEKEDAALFRQTLHNGINEGELVSIKIATTLPPYTENLNEYEWVNGEINIKGTIYQYVKRKIIKDSIEYLCVPDYTKMRYESAREQFFQLCSDLQQNTDHKKSGNTNQVKLCFFEYCSFDAPFAAFEQSGNLISSFFINHTSKPVKKPRYIDHPPETSLVFG